MSVNSSNNQVMIKNESVTPVKSTNYVQKRVYKIQNPHFAQERNEKKKINGNSKRSIMDSLSSKYSNETLVSKT